MLLLAMSCLMLAGGVRGYPNGPPLSSCDTMFPTGHKADAMTSAPPYELVVSPSTFTGQGQNLTVTLSTTGNPAYPYFEGMFVQARLASCYNDKPVGEFVIPVNDDFLQVMDCDASRSRSAVAHKNHTHQTMKSFIWTSPVSEPGNIYFRATVVKNTTTFWTNVFSQMIRDTSDDDVSDFKPCDYCTVRAECSAPSLIAVTSLLMVSVILSWQLN